MKKTVFFLMTITIGLIFNAYAADMPMVVPAQVEDTSKLVEVHNKFCPISHEEVGQNGMTPFKEIYNGKIYNLCCSMCDKDFKKDPATYAKMLDEQAAKEAEEGAK